MKYSIRGMMIMAAWASVVGAAFATTMSIDRPNTAIPVGVLWIFVTLFIMAVVIGAIVVRGQTRPFWIGCSVVAVGFVVAAASNNLTMYHTTVLPIANALTSTQEIANDPAGNLRILKRESVRRIIDLGMIPVLSTFGGLFSAYLSKPRTLPIDGR